MRPLTAALLLGLLVVVYYALRLLQILGYDDRRPWRGGDDETFQGDGWRWTLSLLLPGVPIPEGLLRPSPGFGIVADALAEQHGARPPFTLDMLPLTIGQRMTCWAEWAQAQAEQAWLGRPLERWETFDREEQP